jgi:hypothetical protein
MNAPRRPQRFLAGLALVQLAALVAAAGGVVADLGGRVAEYVARPLLNAFTRRRAVPG